jgi:uncharacterized GH25 family protein
MWKLLKNLSAVILTLFGLTVTSDAHDFWIEPTLFQPEVGERVEFNLRVGQNLSGETLPWIPDWFLDYRVIGPEGAKPVRAIIGDIPAGSFEPEQDAIYTVGYFSGADLADLDAEKFNTYLKKEGLEHALKIREDSGTENERGREFYSRCAKTLVKSGDGTDVSAMSTVIGYPLEIVPLNNPYELQSASSNNKLRIKILYDSEPISGLAVFAFNAANPKQQQRVATDSNGEATLEINSNGTWLIKAVHLFEIENDKAEWESFWASLTFRL